MPISSCPTSMSRNETNRNVTHRNSQTPPSGATVMPIVEPISRSAHLTPDMSVHRKKLIEVSLSLETINRVSVQEKLIRYGIL